MKLLHVDTIDSTNEELKHMAAAGAGTTVLVADEQTDGKGRAGRTFCSPSGSGLYLSVLLRSIPTGDVQTVTPRTAVAACRAISRVFGITPGIKWVNDIVTPRGKIAGILTEAGFHKDGTLDWVVMGIGINICEPAGGFSKEVRNVAGSILPGPLPKESFEKKKEELTRAFLEEFFYILKTDGIKAYRSYSVTIGKLVKVYNISKEKEEGKEAVALAIDDDYSLLVRYADGREEKLHTGEVSLSF